VITTQTEHKCVLDSCRILQQQGFEITYLPVQQNGLICMKQLEVSASHRPSRSKGFRVRGRSRGRFATPAYLPLCDCSPYSHIHARRDVWDLSIVQGPISVARAKP
jgi:hypothetical protein